MEFVHPGEETAWNSLLNNKIFQTVVDVFQSIYTDLTSFGAMKGRNFLVTESTMPEVYELYQLAAERLGIGQKPPLYIQMEYGIKIQTLGTDGDCAVLLNSACLEECSREQLLALFGQELTHVRYRHLRILNMDAMLDSLLTKIPAVGPVASQTLKTLLLQWKEYAYYTADRGAAIAAGEKLPVFQNLSMAMGRKLEADGVASLLGAQEDHGQISASQSIAAKAVMQMMISGIAAPFGIWRIRELDKWTEDLAQVRDSLAPQQTYTSAAQKTVNTLDAAAVGIYHGAVKTAEAVKQGKENLDTYVEENKPIWEENIAQAKEKTAEAIKKGKEDLSAYVEENKPIWEENIVQAKEKTTEAIKKGKEDLSAYVEENMPIWEENLAQAKEAAAGAMQAGMHKAMGLMNKFKSRKK